MFKDYFGNELHLNDEVAFNSPNRGSSSFLTGRITRFTNTMVCISYHPYGDEFTSHTKKMPSLVIKKMSNSNN